MDRPTAEAPLTALPRTALVTALQEQDLALLDGTPVRVVRLGTAPGRTVAPLNTAGPGHRAGGRRRRARGNG
ncbi:hypothetical protein AB0F30_36685 [Streptomyces sp. NPDC029006]|uniref:hypothetical protein n=1 Tax=Streptomyces sp. NPDC029006 TaxID=3155467 RepID=UPI0033F12C98